MRTRKVCIIGGGVTGLCAAYYAARRGYAVTVVQREPEGGDNCSMGNAGMIVPSHFVPLAAPGMISQGLRWMFNPESPFFVRPRLDPSLARWGWLFYRHANARHVAASRELLRDLNLESRRLFVELEEEESFGLQRRGLLMLCKTAAALEEEAHLAKEANEIGVAAEVLDSPATAALDTAVTMDVAGSVYFPKDCHLAPEAFMASMRKRVLALGVDIVPEVEIESFETRNGAIVSASGGGWTFEADEFVIAGGSWSSGLLAKLGRRLPLQAGKGYSLTLPEPPELPALCSIFTEAKVAITPMGSSLRFGGTMEVGGLDLSIDRKRVMGIVKSVSGYFPKFGLEDFDKVEPWAGLRPVSPDGIPYLGRLRGIPNAIVATGHAMMGLSLGPVTGRLVGDLLAGDMPFRPIDAMAPGRF
ncbi:NAD(P)/FAD-dependent oxidoreductase [Haloferula sargassicola]|uniref:D-amino acid dehydrogenase 1 n=1 Tax=Haloferula sargassicola TaxID=490096 RepID=A0ABP9UTR8_9BACT